MANRQAKPHRGQCCRSGGLRAPMRRCGVAARRRPAAAAMLLDRCRPPAVSWRAWAPVAAPGGPAEGPRRQIGVGSDLKVQGGQPGLRCCVRFAYGVAIIRLSTFLHPHNHQALGRAPSPRAAAADMPAKAAPALFETLEKSLKSEGEALAKRVKVRRPQGPERRAAARAHHAQTPKEPFAAPGRARGAGLQHQRAG